MPDKLDWDGYLKPLLYLLSVKGFITIISTLIYIITIIVNFSLYTKCLGSQDIINYLNISNLVNRLNFLYNQPNEENNEQGTTETRKFNLTDAKLVEIINQELEKEANVNKIKKITNLANAMNILSIIILFANFIFTLKIMTELPTKSTIGLYCLYVFLVMTFSFSINHSINCKKNREKGYKFINNNGMLYLNIISFIIVIPLFVIFYLFLELGIEVKT